MSTVIDGYFFKSRCDVSDDSLAMVGWNDLVFLAMQEEDRNTQSDLTVEAYSKRVVSFTYSLS
jgi:hypothetical protein